MGVADGGHPVADAELGQNVGDVGLDGFRTDADPAAISWLLCPMIAPVP
jgi:hypothetical protein